MKKWCGKFPFPCWLIVIFLLLACDIGLYFHEQRQAEPKKLAELVQNDFLNRESQLKKSIDQNDFSKPIDKTVLNSLSNYFSVIVFQGDSMVYWNASDLSSERILSISPNSFRTPKIARFGPGYYYVHSFLLESANRYVVALIPIAFKFKYPHKYFHSYFVAGKQIAPETKIGNSGIEIKNLDGQPAFHLSFKNNPTQLFEVNGWVGLLTVLLLFCLFLWIHKVCLFQSERFKPIVGWLTLLGFALLFNGIRILVGYPPGFENTNLFSSSLLASSSNIPSLVDLLFYILFEWWLLFYIVKYVPVNSLIPNKKQFLFIFLRIFLVALLLVEIYFIQITNVFTLIINSKLSLFVGDLQNLNVYTLIGCAGVCLVTLNVVFSISIINDLLAIFRKRIWRYPIFISGSLICVFLFAQHNQIIYNLLMVLMSTICLLIINRFGRPIKRYTSIGKISHSSPIYLWLAILCVWVTVQIFYFNFSKERDLRKVYAARQEQGDRGLLNYSFEALKQDIEQDKLLKTLWANPSAETVNSISSHLIFHYMGGVFQKFSTHIYYYDTLMKPIYPRDTLGYGLNKLIEKLTGKNQNDGLISLQKQMGTNEYWTLFPIKSQINNAEKLGYIGIKFSLSLGLRNSPNALLLQPENNPSDEQYFKDYDFAIYKNHKLTAQSGNYPFPFQAYFDSKNRIYVFKDSWFYSNLFYQASPKELIVVRYQRSIGTNIISLFNYVLVVWLLLWSVFFLTTYFSVHSGNRKRWRNWLGLTIRAKINWTIMLTVFLSLLVVGGITVSFLNNRYQASQQQNLRNLMLYFGQNVIHYFEKQDSALTEIGEEQTTNQEAQLAYLLNRLANEQGLDINLYSNRGKLVATSQSVLLQRGVLSTLMNPSALQSLEHGLNTDWHGIEKIGQFNYQSLYIPLRNKNEKIIGYLNLPNYTSTKIVKTRLYGMLSTLIDIYLLIFFIAGIAAWLISSSILRSFYLLIERFRKIRLEDNAVIFWPYHDELSILVSEYNHMIRKVEKMATKLANTEREAAWRELALQIAHEIKNPLTPMKLNVEYLRKAIKEKRINLTELTEKVTDSIIEQIENLDIIATEFAHFARMPEAKPEEFSVVEQLSSLINLYQDDGIKISLESDTPDVLVWMDKGYFMRIFSNLIKNGIQSMPSGKSNAQIFISIQVKQNNRIKIKVSDNGSGIPKEAQGRIFTPHFTTKSSGSGIGLAMAKNMVEQSGGEINFDSRLDEGTDFFVYLPKYIPPEVNE